MPRKMLTEEFVERLRPPPAGKQVDYFDARMPGLVLRVNYGGAKVWRVLHYMKKERGGRTVTVATTRKLGRYPKLKLKEARVAARNFDPKKVETQLDSVKAVAAEFIKRHVSANKLRTQSEIERCINKYILPRWAERSFVELRRRDVTKLLDDIEDQHGQRQADIVLGIFRKMTNWYASRTDDYVSPVVHGMHRSNGSERKRKRILADEEIRAVWSACDDLDRYGALLKVLLLTAQRKDKVASMRWEDLKDDEWIIATEPREKGNAGTLRLPPMVRDIIQAQPRIAGNPYVFAGRGAGPMTNFAQRKDELDAKLPGMPPWVIHDLRRTARSLLSRAGVRPDIAERVLGHAIRGVEGVYDHHSYADEKADALTKLAALVERILNPPAGNVVTLHAQA